MGIQTKNSTFLTLLAAVLFSLPGVSYAADSIVPCFAGNECNFCHIVTLANNVVSFIMLVVASFIVLVFVLAGFRLVMAGGNPGKIAAAKAMFSNALIGFIIVMCAWLVIDTIMKSLIQYKGAVGETQFGPWNTIDPDDCGSQDILRDGRPIEFEHTQWELVDELIQPGGDYMPEGYYDFVVYEMDLEGGNDCKIKHGGVTNDLAACYTSMANLKASLAGSTYSMYDGCADSDIFTISAWVNTIPDCGGGSTSIVSDIVACDTSNMSTVNLMGHSVTVHNNVVSSVKSIDAAWKAKGGSSFYDVHTLYSYNCRNISGTNKKSAHSYGLALDINPKQNPHNKSSTCTTDFPPEFVSLFTSRGWGWGCNWSSSKDAMHFSKAANEGGNMSY